MVKTQIFTSLILVIGMCAFSHAQSIGVSFAGDNGGGTANQITPSQTAGVVPAANWNAASGDGGTVAGLTDDAGDATSASVTWSSPNTWGGSGATTDDEAMVNGWLDDGGGTGSSVEVVGIPFDNYDVYVYGSSDDGNAGRGWTTNVNGTSYFSVGAFTNLSPNGSYFDGSAYVDGAAPGDDPSFMKITGLSGSTLSIVGARDSAGPLGDYRGAISGFQIVQVPEPASLLIVLTGLLGLLSFRRRG